MELAAKNHQNTLIANHAINRVIQKGTQRLFNKYLKTKMPAHLATVVTKHTEHAIDQHALPNDTGEKIDTLLTYWCEEEQPEVANLDSWAVLSLKAQYRPDTSFADQASVTKSVGKSSLLDLSVRISNFASNLRPFSAGLMSMLGSSSTVSQNTQRGKRAKSARNRGPKYIPEILPADDPEHDPEPDDPMLDRMREERDLIKTQKAEDARIQRAILMQEKEREESRRKMDRKLYDKLYTSDYEGQVIMIKPPDVDGLPETSIHPGTDTNKPPKVIKFVSHVTKEIGLPGQKKQIQPPPTRAPVGKRPDPKKFVSARDFPYPKTPALEEVLKVQMGVKMTTKGREIEGPPLARPNQMTRDEYMKIIDEKMEQQKEHYKKIVMGPNFVDHVLEEAMKKQEESMKNKLEEAYQSRPESPKKTKKMQLHIHDQEQLVKMLVESPVQDPKEKEEEAKRIKRHQQKIMALKKVEEEERLAKEIFDRVSAYERNVEGEVVPKNPQPQKPLGLHKNVEEFNKQIGHDSDWGRPLLKTNRTAEEEEEERIQLLYSEKRKIKPQTLDPHIPKEPRVRLTITQKLSKIVTPNDSRPQTALRSPASGFAPSTSKSTHSLVSPKDTGKKPVYLKLPKEIPQKVVKLPSISTSNIKSPTTDAFKSPSTFKSTTAGMRTVSHAQENSQGETSTNRDSAKKPEKFFLSNSRFTPKGNNNITADTSHRPQTQSGKRMT